MQQQTDLCTKASFKKVERKRHHFLQLHRSLPMCTKHKAQLSQMKMSVFGHKQLF